jgi:tRNA (adenine22-N1)-methyltransferase
MNDYILNLGPRLQVIASFIRAGSLLGDIGTDHAYLPVYLVQKGIIRRAVGVDIHEGPYRSALETVRTYGLSNLIEVRLGNGLRPLQPGEVNVLVVAGMGGNTILKILSASEDVLQEVEELVLQPQGAEGKVRRELLVRGWKIKEELLVEEEGRI